MSTSYCPYKDIGAVLRGRVAWVREGGGASCRGKRFEGSSSTTLFKGDDDFTSLRREMSLVEKKNEYKYHWKRTLEDAVNKRAASSALAAPSATPLLPFEVHYSGETAMSMLTAASPLHFYITFNTRNGELDETTAKRFAKMHNPALGFDASSIEDVMLVAEAVREFIDALVEKSLSKTTENGSRGVDAERQRERTAITVVRDDRDGMYGFVVRNVPLRPPQYVTGADSDECDDEEDASHNKKSKKAAMLVDLRVTLPCGIGPTIHRDTVALTENMGAFPFLHETIQAAILWAKGQRFYLDDEGFVRLYAKTRTETVLRGTAVEDLFYRMFGTMSISSLLIRAGESEELVSAGAGDDPLAGAEDTDVCVGRAFMAFVRFLASKKHFCLGPSSSSSSAVAAPSLAPPESTLLLPTITDEARSCIQLHSVVGRGGTAAYGAERRDCRKQYHYVRELAELTDKLLKTPPEELEEDMIIRFFGRSLMERCAAAGVQYSSISSGGSGSDIPEEEELEEEMTTALRQWIDSVLFGVISEDRNDNEFVDPLRTIRSCSRCEDCGVGNVAKSLQKGQTLCLGCQVSKLTRAAHAQLRREGGGACDLLGGGHTQNGRGGERGRGGARGGRGNNTIETSSNNSKSNSAGATMRTKKEEAAQPSSLESMPTGSSSSSGRGRGRGGRGGGSSPPPPPAEDRSAIDGINYEGICIGCSRERPYLIGKPLADVCMNCR